MAVPDDAVTTTGRRTQAERRSESEEALLAAAAELVAERGIDGASLARIGERAGGSRGLANHHFGSKDTLIERLARRAQDRIEQAMIEGLVARGVDPMKMTALERVLLSVDVYLERFEDPSPEEWALIVVWGACFPAEASVEGMLEADRRSRGGWAEHIRVGQQDGSIRTDLDPESTAALIAGMIRGVAGMMLTDGGVDSTELRRSCATWVNRALVP